MTTEPTTRGARKLAFTDARIEALPLPELPPDFNRAKLGNAVVTYRDTKVAGLAVRVSPTGAKVYAFAYRAPGSRRARRVTLGRFPALSVKAARAEAARLASHVAARRDPQAERTAERAGSTVAEVFATYCADCAGRVKPSTLKLYAALFKHIGKAYGRVRVKDVTVDDVDALAAKLKAKQTTANQCTRLASTLFRFAMRKRLRPDNPALFALRYKEQTAERYLKPDELAAVLRALDIAEHTGLPTATKHRRKPGRPEHRKHASPVNITPASPFAVGALRLLALTGMRKQEALTLRRDAVDVAARVVTLADTKSGRSTRPLNAAALDVLASMPRLVGSPFYFPSLTNPKRPLYDITKLWDSVREHAHVEHVRLHDLRHTAASLMVQSGATLAEIQRAVGHKSARSTARYAAMNDAGAQSAVDKLGAAVAAIAARPEPVAADVVSIGTARRKVTG